MHFIHWNVKSPKGRDRHSYLWPPALWGCGVRQCPAACWQAPSLLSGPSSEGSYSSQENLNPELEPRALSSVHVPSHFEKVPLALHVCVGGGGRECDGDLSPALPFPRVEAALPDLVSTVRVGGLPEAQPEWVWGVCWRMLLLPEDRLADPQGAGGVLVQENVWRLPAQRGFHPQVRICYWLGVSGL